MAVKFHINLRRPSRVEPAENGLHLKGTGDAHLVLIHGLTGTPNEMKFLATYFNRRGYTVSCPRLANHGQPIEILKNTPWEDFYESARQAVLNIQKTVRCSVFVAGLSMGALLSLLLADEFPDRIAGVSCLSPTLFYDGWNTPWSKHLLPLAYWTPLKHVTYFKEEPPYGIKNEAIRQRVHDYYQKADLRDLNGVAKYGYPYFPVKLLCELHSLIRYLTPRLRHVRAPVQCIQAKNDDMTSVKNSQFIYDRVSSEVKEIVMLNDSYHIITADQERDKVAESMESFFSRIQPGALYAAT